MKRKVEGSMSVFFSLSITAILLLFCVLFKLSRIYIVQTGGRQTLDLCASSTLAGYCEELQERYGLFALESVDAAKDDMGFFLNENLNMKQFELEPLAYITDELIYEAQIAEYMKYRVLVSLITQYTDIMDLFNRAQENQEYVEEEMDTSGVVEKYTEYFADFITALEGIEVNGSKKEPSVKGFWNQEWNKETYETILVEAKEEEILHKHAISSWIDRIRTYKSVAEEAVELWKMVCNEGAYVKEELQKKYQIAESDTTRQQIEDIMKELHTGDESDQNILINLKNNIRILEEAETALDTLLLSLKGPYDITESIKLLQYTESIYVNYQVNGKQDKRSWRELWNSMQDYTTDLSGYVNDEKRYDKNVKQTLPSASIGEETEDGSLMKIPEAMRREMDSASFFLSSRLYNVEYAVGLFYNLQEVIERKENEEAEILDMNGEEKEVGVFQAEVEYVICGKASDLANCRGTRTRIIAIRMPFNLLHLTTNPEKLKTIQTAAASTGGVIVPGIGNIVMHAVITGVWGAMESYVDYEKLIHGETVPIIKTDDTWNTDLDNAWETDWMEAGKQKEIIKYEGGNEKSESKENVKEAVKEEISKIGLKYADYLKIILIFTSEEKVERRIQDLIQLNLQKQTGTIFYLKDMPAWFLVNGEYEADGRTYTVKGEYGY